MSDVARALSQPPTYLTKFICSELDAQTPADEKNDCYIVNGVHGPGFREYISNGRPSLAQQEQLW
jgi:hypothetical protein